MSTISIQLVSDLHLEIGHGQDSGYEGFKIVPKAETLALLGDIGAICDDRLFEFLRRQLLQFKRVFYVLGNHEFYRMNRVCRSSMLTNNVKRNVYWIYIIRMTPFPKSRHLPHK
jgi:UDP-2,3-diacylglucosamine pyrophosphatase LpxH